MQTLESLRRRLESARDLGSIVTAMKSLAAVRIRQFREAVEAIEPYDDTVELALQVALRTRTDIRATEPEGLALLVVLGAGQGLVGQFDTRIAGRARKELAKLRDPYAVYAVGSRIAGRLGAGVPVEREFPIPTSVDGVADAVRHLLIAVQELRTRRGVRRIIVAYNGYESGASYEPTARQVLPVDPELVHELEAKSWAGPSLPMHRTDWATLFAAVVREYLFTALFRAFVESLASENASRLAAMEAAERRIDERLGELEQRYNHYRQQTITEELMEVVAGFEALGGQRAP